MRIHSTGILLAAALSAGGLGVSGCVSINSFDKHIDEINQRHNALASRVDELSGRVTALDGKVNSVAQAAQAAQGSASAAATAAEGKFAMTEVGREQVTFATGSAALSDEAKATLTALAERLVTENKNVYLEIRGHADVRGGKQANRQLGRERAGVVGRFLAGQGVPGAKMQLGSWGEDQPKADEKTAETHAENRRVEIVVLK